MNCCYLLDAVLSAEQPSVLEEIDLGRVNLVVPDGYLMAKMEDHVSNTFSQVVKTVRSAGAKIAWERLAAVEQIPKVSSKGGFAAAEAYYYHQQYMADHGEHYDQRVLSRIADGKYISACDYQEIINWRQIVQNKWTEDERFDALLLPTTPITARPLAALAADKDFFAVNGLYLRNPSIANVLDCPSISIPCHQQGKAPVGLMLVGKQGQDRKLFRVAKAVETVLSSWSRFEIDSGNAIADECP